MKRKFFSWLLAGCMVVPAAFAFNACGGGSSLHTITESEWQEYFDEVNFEMRSGKVDSYLYVAQNSYGIRGIEYGKNLSYGGETLEYYKAEEGEIVSCEAEEYVDYAAEFAPFFTFIHDHYGDFVMHQDANDESMQFFVYDDELPEAVQESLDKMIAASCTNGWGTEPPTYNYHSIVVIANYQFVKEVRLMDGEYDPDSLESVYDQEHCFSYLLGIGEQKDYQMVTQIEKEKEMEAHFQKVEEALKSVADYDDENTNFVVKGGSGVDYMEFYFTDKGMRFYTPNANAPQISGDSNIYVDGIYTKEDDGTYKYYKQAKGGEWSVQEITADRYDTTLETFYENYCGGKWFSEIYAFAEMDFSQSSFRMPNEFTGSMSPYTLKYYNISVSFDENDKIESATWKLEMQLPEIYGGTKVTYDFTLTAGNASFTVPTIG